MIKTKARKTWEWSCEFYPPKQVFLDFWSAKTNELPGAPPPGPQPGALPLDPTRGPKNLWFVKQILIILLLSIVVRYHDSGICRGSSLVCRSQRGVFTFLVSTKGDGHDHVLLWGVLLVATAPPPPRRNNERSPKTSFFQTIFSSGDPPFQALLQLQRSHFLIFWKQKYIFKPNFRQFYRNFSSWDANFSKKFAPETPDLSLKKSIPETLL